MFSIGTLFTEEERKEAAAIYEKHQSGPTLHEELKKLAQRALPRINEVTGQENHVAYLAYVLEAACMKVRS